MAYEASHRSRDRVGIWWGSSRAVFSRELPRSNPWFELRCRGRSGKRTKTYFGTMQELQV